MFSQFFSNTILKITALVFIILTLVSQNAFSIENIEKKNSLNDLTATIFELVDQRILDVEIFKRALDNHSIKLKVNTLKGLGRIGGKSVLPLIEPCLSNDEPRVRRAAVFAAGLSGSLTITDKLWEILKTEQNEIVKQEIYLALGNLGSEQLVSRMLARLDKESNPKTRGALFQGLAAAITYIESVSDQIGTHKNSTDVDFTKLLRLFEKDGYVAFRVGYFLARVKKIEKLISPAQLQKFTKLTKNPDNKRMLARLIGRITKQHHLANRGLLSWLIEQSESNDIALASESILAMGNLLYIPQARIQLGKLTIDENALIAQMALQVLADSSWEGMQIMGLLKKQLKSSKPGMVVAAMSGLAKRQKRDEMTWALKILAHKNTFIKIRFAKIIADKDLEGFRNVLGFLSKDPNQSVAKFANDLLEQKPLELGERAKTPSYEKAQHSVGKQVLLTTSAGDIRVEIGDTAIYTGANFLRLVKNGYYNGTYFSRMLGNFVAQGGDSVGDVEGGSGETIREEISYQSHTKGTIGIATSGKDTGDAQIFVNIGDNIHLDRHYSVFARVISGMDVVQRLSNGDQILTAKIIN